MAKSKKTMKPDEEAAMDAMIAAARGRSKGGQVKLAKWRDKIRISGLAGKVPVWLYWRALCRVRSVFRPSHQAVAELDIMMARAREQGLIVSQARRFVSAA
jgi:hypothetical protein